MENSHCLSLCIAHKKDEGNFWLQDCGEEESLWNAAPLLGQCLKGNQTTKVDENFHCGSARTHIFGHKWLQVQIYEDDFRKERADRERLNEEKEALQKMNERLQSQLNKLNSQVWVKRKLPLPAHVHFIFIFSLSTQPKAFWLPLIDPGFYTRSPPGMKSFWSNAVRWWEIIRGDSKLNRWREYLLQKCFKHILKWRVGGTKIKSRRLLIVSLALDIRVVTSSWLLK